MTKRPKTPFREPMSDPKRESASADRAETVKETHGRWRRSQLEAEARTFGNEWGNKPGIDRGKQAEALADLMERIQSDAVAEAQRELVVARTSLATIQERAKNAVAEARAEERKALRFIVAMELRDGSATRARILRQFDAREKRTE